MNVYQQNTERKRQFIAIRQAAVDALPKDVPILDESQDEIGKKSVKFIAGVYVVEVISASGNEDLSLFDNEQAAMVVFRAINKHAMPNGFFTE